MSMSEKAAYDNKSAKMPNMIAKVQGRSRRANNRRWGIRQLSPTRSLKGCAVLKKEGSDFLKHRHRFFSSVKESAEKELKTRSRKLQEG